MANARTKVVVTRRLPEPIETRMSELFDVKLNLDDKPMSSAELIEAVESCEVLVPTITDRIDAGILSHANPEFRLIANFGAGVDHIDLASCRQRRITVTSTPGVLTEDTADLTIALMLAIPRRILDGEAMVRAGDWSGWSPTHMLGRRIGGKRLGIIGMGRIGQAVAQRARAFGMSVHYHNRRRLPADVEDAYEATYWESLDQMLVRMDVISVHCPHTPSTYHLLSARRLELMQPRAFIINTSRGEVIDESALVRLMSAGQIGGAGLDVHERAPEVNPKLLELPNVIVLPHMGSATVESRNDMGEKVLINIKTFVDGHTPPDRVLEDWV
ncbi:MAG: D-glycerate dehydrogenase [Pseudomonadota bacterium]